MFAGTDDIVGPEGMEKFCEDIGVEPENVSSETILKMPHLLWCTWVNLTVFAFPPRIKKFLRVQKNSRNNQGGFETHLGTTCHYFKPQIVSL